jgi:hypothetical protein
MGKAGRRFLPNLKKLGSPRLNFDEREEGNPVLDYYNDIKTKPQLF